jgi:hypothetical protein
MRRFEYFVKHFFFFVFYANSVFVYVVLRGGEL